MAHKHSTDLIKIWEVSTVQDYRQNSDVNGRDGMVLNRRSGETITGGIRSQWKIRSRVEVAAVKGRVAYQKSRLEGGTDLIPTT